MLKKKTAREVMVRMPNESGALDLVAKTIADTGVNGLAVSGWVEGAYRNRYDTNLKGLPPAKAV